MGLCETKLQNDDQKEIILKEREEREYFINSMYSSIKRITKDTQTSNRLILDIEERFPNKPNEWVYEKVLDDLLRNFK